MHSIFTQPTWTCRECSLSASTFNDGEYRAPLPTPVEWQSRTYRITKTIAVISAVKIVRVQTPMMKCWRDGATCTRPPINANSPAPQCWTVNDAATYSLLICTWAKRRLKISIWNCVCFASWWREQSKEIIREESLQFAENIWSSHLHHCFLHPCPNLQLSRNAIVAHCSPLGAVGVTRWRCGSPVLWLQTLLRKRARKAGGTRDGNAGNHAQSQRTKKPGICAWVLPIFGSAPLSPWAFADVLRGVRKHKFDWCLVFRKSSKKQQKKKNNNWAALEKKDQLKTSTVLPSIEKDQIKKIKWTVRVKKDQRKGSIELASKKDHNK